MVYVHARQKNPEKPPLWGIFPCQEARGGPRGSLSWTTWEEPVIFHYLAVPSLLT